MDQFKALAKKNFLLWRRGFIGSLLEIILPIALFTIILIIRNTVEIQYTKEKQNIANQTVSYYLKGNYSIPFSILPYLKNCPTGKSIGLSPSDSEIVGQLKNYLTDIEYSVIIYNSKQQIQQLLKDASTDEFCFVINILSQDNGNYTYEHRDRLEEGTIDPRQPLMTNDTVNEYSYMKIASQTSMMFIPAMINSIIFQRQKPSNIPTFNAITRVSPIKNEAFTFDNFYFYFGGSVGIVVLLPLILIFARQVSLIMMEKQKKIRDTMCIMGMRLPYYYLTWFLHYYFIYFLINIFDSVITIISLPSIPYYIPFVIFLLFHFVLVIQAFFIELFFARTIYAVITACLFFCIECFLTGIVADPDWPTVQIFQIASIVPHVAVFLAFKEMLYAESKNIPISFSAEINLYTINTCIISLACNIIFWGLLTLYLSRVVPGVWRRKHPCFMFGKTLEDSGESEDPQSNFKSQKNLKESSKFNSLEIESEDERIKDMKQRNKVIRIKNLVKNFDQFKAVKGLNLTIPSDEIFVLLGPNGAGKTTTISMITGIHQPTQGSVSIFGQTNKDNFRDIIGLCPQIDPLYSDLTGEEHLRLFGSLKGIQADHLQDQINELLKDVDLQNQKDQITSTYSGGQKRKLSVAISFTGGSKVIILDEPTAGMDTYARRHIWEMLKNYRSKRVIMMTTHLMDEADHLGDRIGILMEGKLATCGSNVYLKNKFGSGYNLTIVKEKHVKNSEKIVLFVAKYISNMSVTSDFGSELKFQLPLKSLDKFDKLFRNLEENKKSLGIKEYGIRITTLQEVFLHLCERQINEPQKQILKEEMVMKTQPENTMQMQPTELRRSIVFSDKIEKQVSGCKVFCSQMSTTILKRLRISKRDTRSILFQIILPIFFVVFGLFLMALQISENIGEQTIVPDLYKSGGDNFVLPISANDSTFLQGLTSAVNMKYGNQVDVDHQIFEDEFQFDADYLFPLKKQNPDIKGGIYFHEMTNDSFFPDQPDIIGGRLLTNTTNLAFGPFDVLVNTVCPTSFIAFQNLATQTYINYISNKNISISYINKPLPRNPNYFETTSISSIVQSAFGVGIFTVALAFKFSSIAFLLVKEKQSGSRDQQILCGMKVTSFWIGNFIFDYLTYCILAGFAIGMCFAFGIISFIQTNQHIAALCAIFFIYGISNLLFTYFFSFAFEQPFNALVGVFFFNCASGGILTILMILLRAIDQNKIVPIIWFFRIFPPFSYGEGIVNMGSRRMLQVFGQTTIQIFDINMTLAPIIYLAGTIFVNLLILIIIEVLLYNKNGIFGTFGSKGELKLKLKRKQTDIQMEEEEVQKGKPEQHQILVKELRKIYNQNSDDEVIAVSDISFKVQKGQIFGLLGSNGAGKSTTFKMLTGNLPPTSGEIYFSGLSIRNDLNEIRQNIGYCPQTDPLIDFLTVRQQLELYYDMKCLPSNLKQEIINSQIEELNLKEYENSLSGTLSGGNKRKLSVGIAIIGNPPIIFLDEPSTGMDPKTKRFMWKIIEKISSERKQSTIILTTHSMDEAEALSTRLAIMIEGQFECLGTPQHIKSKYGRGYEIEVKLKKISPEQIEQVRLQINFEGEEVKKQRLAEFIEKINVNKDVQDQLSSSGSGCYIWNELYNGASVSIRTLIDFCLFEEKIQMLFKSLNKNFGSTEILQHFQSYLRFKVLTKVTIGQIFKYMQEQREQRQIEQYSINQATIEQIFNRMAAKDFARSTVKSQ